MEFFGSSGDKNRSVPSQRSAALLWALSHRLETYTKDRTPTSETFQKQTGGQTLPRGKVDQHVTYFVEFII
jgi:hypothetical protein